jgi:GMP synthase-like glutamine amidotransferase
MKPVRLFRHINCSSPGYLCTFLEAQGVPFEVACIGEGVQVPESLDDVSGLIFMGGPGDVNSPIGWMRQEEALIRQAAEHGIPVMGVCLGGQMIAKALGGKVSSDYRLEVGWHTVRSVSGEHGHSFFRNLPEEFRVFQWHAHHFSLPPGATPLLTSECTPCQAFSIGNILAMQFHLEIKADTVRSLTQQFAGDLEKPSTCVQQADELCRDLDTRIKELHDAADLIYSGWLEKLWPVKPLAGALGSLIPR